METGVEHPCALRQKSEYFCKHFLRFILMQSLDVNPTHSFINEAPVLKKEKKNDMTIRCGPYSLIHIPCVCNVYHTWRYGLKQVMYQSSVEIMHDKSSCTVGTT